MPNVAELSFLDKDLGQRWDAVREDFWGDLKSETVRAVKRLLETSMEVEVQDLLGRPRWGHSMSQTGYRNGYYRRSLLTGFGRITDLSVPRLRSGGLRFKTIGRYRRRTKDVDAAVQEVFLAGVSTRRIQEAMAPLFGEREMSATTVSSITKSLNVQVQAYHHRPIADVYRYIFLDGIYLKAKSPVHSRRRCVLVAYGIRSDGVRELIDFKLARNGESQAAWECFLTNLRNRGFRGAQAELAVLDGNVGLWNAVDMVWPHLRCQLCWAHKLRNVANHLPKRLQKPCMSQAREIYAAESRGLAVRAFQRWERIWKPIAPEAVRCLNRDMEDLLPFYDCPCELWVKLRTTNAIERIFREVRRRTRPMSCFTNIGSVERITYAIFSRMNRIWREKPLKITQNS
jgi:transposase-like protein